MFRAANHDSLKLSAAAQAALITGARDTEPVRGLTHGFYKYPARFSPAFVRSVIETFTRPGDLILDPHVGGGTTLVESLALGRDAIGVDISTLAEFVTRVKTTVFSKAELKQLASWARRLPTCVNIHKSSAPAIEYLEHGYYKHLNHRDRWRLRKAAEQAMASAVRLGSARLEAFGRCVVLRTAQWALDGRSKQTSVSEFREFLCNTAEAMVGGAGELSAAVTSGKFVRPSIEVWNRSSAGLEDEFRMRQWRSPRLVVTSPPYPGVHVLYHRWQVDGRKETPFPFVIANKLDGAGGSHYTMGDRKNPELKAYFENIRATATSIAALANEKTVIVQMVAFADASSQLPRYLQTMREAGLDEVFLSSLQGERDGRLWRSVPGRRWYSDQRGHTPGSQEVVLIHRKAANARYAMRSSCFAQNPAPTPPVTP